MNIKAKSQGHLKEGCLLFLFQHVSGRVAGWEFQFVLALVLLATKILVRVKKVLMSLNL
jgi:hypothetical protein